MDDWQRYADLVARQSELFSDPAARALSRASRTPVTEALEAALLKVIDAVKPDLFLEVGAFEASFSRRMKSAFPNTPAIALEANPRVHARFAEAAAAAGVDYRHAAADAQVGETTFFIPDVIAGRTKPYVSRMGSLLKIAAPDSEMTEVTVPTVTLDSIAAPLGAERICLWADVEGAMEQVLGGAEATLAHTALLYCEIEHRAIWTAQTVASEVVARMEAAGFVLAARDFQTDVQFNALFLRAALAGRVDLRAILGDYAQTAARMVADLAGGADEAAAPAAAPAVATSAPPRPLVHIGLAKAASTFLQMEFFSRAPGIANLGKFGVPPETKKAIQAITRRSSADWTPACATALRDAAHAAAGQGLRPVLSDEDLSVYKVVDPEMMARRLRAVLGDYDVLLILREPIDWLTSNYLFRLSNAHPIAAMGFEHWLETHLTNPRVGSDAAEIWFHALARTYHTISRGRLHLLPYELMRADRARFAHELGAIMDIPGEQVAPLLDVSPKAAAPKLRITAEMQTFFELFRWIVLREPAEAERRLRAFLASQGFALPADLDARLAALAADGSGREADQPAPDEGAWRELFHQIARHLPRTGRTADPAFPKAIRPRVEALRARELTKLRRDFDFDPADYGLSYAPAEADA